MTWPLLSAPGRLGFVNMDVFGNIWALAWDVHQAARDPLRLFDSNMFYPQTLSLAYAESLLPQALMAAPVIASGLAAPGLQRRLHPVVRAERRGGVPPGGGDLRIGGGRFPGRPRFRLLRLPVGPRRPPAVVDGAMAAPRAPESAPALAGRDRVRRPSAWPPSPAPGAQQRLLLPAHGGCPRRSRWPRSGERAGPRAAGRAWSRALLVSGLCVLPSSRSTGPCRNGMASPRARRGRRPGAQDRRATWTRAASWRCHTWPDCIR